MAKFYEKKSKYHLRRVENTNHNREEANFSRKIEEPPLEESQKFTKAKTPMRLTVATGS